MKRLALLVLGGLLACASQIPEKVELKPEAENVEFAYETPSAAAYKLLGTVTGVAAANDPDQAQEAAKNDLRNKAAELGAVIVTIDENTGALLPLESRTKVKLVGRAYKPVD
jgi:Domain of unknown function (DUF4156)